MDQIPDTFEKSIDSQIYSRNSLLSKVLTTEIFGEDSSYYFSFYTTSNPVRASVYNNGEYIESKSINLNVVDVYESVSYTSEIDLLRHY